MNLVPVAPALVSQWTVLTNYSDLALGHDGPCVGMLGFVYDGASGWGAGLGEYRGGGFWRGGDRWSVWRQWWCKLFTCWFKILWKSYLIHIVFNDGWILLSWLSAPPFCNLLLTCIF